MNPKFKVGDVICSALSGPKEVLEIRRGRSEDTRVVTFPNGTTLTADYTGELCYVLKYINGKKLTVLYSVEDVDNGHHLKGTERYKELEAMY